MIFFERDDELKKTSNKTEESFSYNVGMAIPRKISLLEEARNRGIEEWQFNISRGLRKIKSIPRGPRGILGNKMSWFAVECYFIWL